MKAVWNINSVLESVLRNIACVLALLGSFAVLAQTVPDDGSAVSEAVASGSVSGSATMSAPNDSSAIAGNTDSDGKPAHPLRPYKATYKTSTRGLTLTLERSLAMDENGDCRLTSEGRLLVAGISEVSIFAVDNERILPKSYVYQLSGPISRRREVHFDPNAEVIRSLYKKEWYDLPKEDDTLDRMSQQEQLRLLLLNDPTPQDDLEFRVADGRKVKVYKLRFEGEEIIDTPMGPVVTLHFERDDDDPDKRSGFWVAPAWDYLMVKTVHLEDGRTTEVNLVKARIAGKPVRGERDS